MRAAGAKDCSPLQRSSRTRPTRGFRYREIEGGCRDRSMPWPGSPEFGMGGTSRCRHGKAPMGRGKRVEPLTVSNSAWHEATPRNRLIVRAEATGTSTAPWFPPAGGGGGRLSVSHGAAARWSGRGHNRWDRIYPHTNPAFLRGLDSCDLSRRRENHSNPKFRPRPPAGMPPWP